MGTGSFPGVKLPGSAVDHPTHLVPRLKKEYGYTSTPHMGFCGLFYGELYVTLLYCTLPPSPEGQEKERKKKRGTKSIR
jgi:hypothetical protein